MALMLESNLHEHEDNNYHLSRKGRQNFFFLNHLRRVLVGKKNCILRKINKKKLRVNYYWTSLQIQTQKIVFYERLIKKI